MSDLSSSPSGPPPLKSDAHTAVTTNLSNMSAGSMHEGVAPAPPWRRFWARTIDMSGFTVLSVLGWAYAVGRRSLTDSEGVLLIASILIVPFLLEAVSYGLFGGTPGKAIFSLHVRLCAGRQSLSFWQYLFRSYAVFFRGMGAGLPLIGWIAMAMQHSRVKHDDQASYDGLKYEVISWPVGLLRYFFGICVALVSSGAATAVLTAMERGSAHGQEIENSERTGEFGSADLSGVDQVPAAPYSRRPDVAKFKASTRSWTNFVTAKAMSLPSGWTSPGGRIVVAPIGLGDHETQVVIDGGGRLWSLWAKVGAVGNA